MAVDLSKNVQWVNISIPIFQDDLNFQYLVVISLGVFCLWKIGKKERKTKVYNAIGTLKLHKPGNWNEEIELLTILHMHK